MITKQLPGSTAPDGSRYMTSVKSTSYAGESKDGSLLVTFTDGSGNLK